MGDSVGEVVVEFASVLEVKAWWIAVDVAGVPAAEMVLVEETGNQSRFDRHIVPLPPVAGVAVVAKWMTVVQSADG